MVVGTQYTTPQSGYQRIDDTNLNIKYVGSWNTTSNSNYSGGSILYTTDYASYIEFYFYGTKLRVFDGICNNRFKSIKITIDEDTESYSCYDSSIPPNSAPSQVCVYEKENLNKKIHYVKIIGEQIDGTASLCMALDCIDIDDDGYMVHCDDNGKLYYDVTPIMTSNTTPAPYVTSASSEFSTANLAYYAFDGIFGDISGWASNEKNGYLILDNGKKLRMNNFIMANGNTDGWSSCMPKNFDLLGSNDGIDYNLINNFKNEIDWKIQEQRLFKLNNVENYRFYKLNITDINNGVHVNVSELRYLLAVDTPFYLIQDNADNKVYNYDEENNTLVEVTDTSILKEDALNNTCVYDLNKVLPLLDTLSDDLTILSNKDKKIIAKGLKVNTSMIIAKTSFSTRLTKNIDFFELISNISETSSIKMAVSVDEGLTWKTWSESGFIDLTNTCPLKEYKTLSEEEKVQWNTFKDEVYTSGMNGKTLNTIDFNSIKEDNMMFAYIFNRDSYADVCEMCKLQYQFDANGSYTLLNSDSVVNIKQSVDAISVTPKKDIELMKVNIGSSGEVNIIQNGGTTDIDLPTDEEVDNMVNGVISDVFA